VHAEAGIEDARGAEPKDSVSDMRRTSRFVATAAAGALAALTGPTVASAAFPTWNPAGAAEGTGTLTLTHDASSASLTCDYTITADLVNDGTSNGGTMTSVWLGPCSTTVPNCFVFYSATALPWQTTKVTGDPTRLRLTMGVGMSFSGSTCSLNGVSVTVSGTVEGDYDGSVGEWSFVAEPGLSSPLGTFTLDGELELRDEATTSPVDLM
jgi:hypothetical protein